MREKIKDYDRFLHIQESRDNVFEFTKIRQRAERKTHAHWRIFSLLHLIFIGTNKS